MRVVPWQWPIESPHTNPDLPDLDAGNFARKRLQTHQPIRLAPFSFAVLWLACFHSFSSRSPLCSSPCHPQIPCIARLFEHPAARCAPLAMQHRPPHVVLPAQPPRRAEVHGKVPRRDGALLSAPFTGTIQARYSQMSRQVCISQPRHAKYRLENLPLCWH